MAESDAVEKKSHLWLDLGEGAPTAYRHRRGGSIRRERQRGQEYEASFDVTRPGYALFKMTWHPDWVAYVDGEVRKTGMLSPGFIGMPVAPGQHTLAALRTWHVEAMDGAVRHYGSTLRSGGGALWEAGDSGCGATSGCGDGSSGGNIAGACSAATGKTRARVGAVARHQSFRPASPRACCRWRTCRDGRFGNKIRWLSGEKSGATDSGLLDLCSHMVRSLCPDAKNNSTAGDAFRLAPHEHRGVAIGAEAGELAGLADQSCRSLVSGVNSRRLIQAGCDPQGNSDRGWSLPSGDQIRRPDAAGGEFELPILGARPD